MMYPLVVLSMVVLVSLLCRRISASVQHVQERRRQEFRLDMQHVVTLHRINVVLPRRASNA